MKIGVITFVKCDNYGAELQAFALQWKLNSLGYDTEVINLEKKNIDMKRNPDVIVGAIKQRIKKDGIKAIISIFRKIKETRKRVVDEIAYKDLDERKHKLFELFFEKKIKHSDKYYSLDDNPLKQISYQHHSLLENLQYFLPPYFHWEHKDFHFYE